jgi:dolichol-phosphate mannosyltransferase
MTKQRAMALRGLHARFRLRLRSLSGFAGVGVAGIAVNQALLAALVQSGVLGYLAAAVVATQAAILFNFALLERWVFAQDATNHVGTRLGRYWGVSNVFLVLGLPLLGLLVSGLGVHYAIANLAVIGMQFASRYIVSDRFIWRTPEVSTADLPRAA